MGELEDKFQGRFRTTSSRLKDWDYSSDGWYFVTICTKDHVPFFGEARGGKVELSAVGKMASRMWEEIPCHHSFVDLDEFIIMPNHIHGVILIFSKKKVKHPQGLYNRLLMERWLRFRCVKCLSL